MFSKYPMLHCNNCAERSPAVEYRPVGASNGRVDAYAFVKPAPPRFTLMIRARFLIGSLLLALAAVPPAAEIGIQSGRERVCQDVYISVFELTIKKKNI